MTIAHIVAGMLAILAGAVALSVAKGGPAHRRYGRVFVGAMLAMAGFGAIMAASRFHIAFQKLNLIAAIFTIYLVVTALLTARRPTPGPRWVDVTSMAVALALGTVAIVFGALTLYTPRGKLVWFPAAPAFVFGFLALLAAAGDLRLVMGRVLERRRRIGRHLWRMCFAMFIATGSFFLGQAKVFPEEFRIFPLLAAPVLLVLAALVYWLVRVLLMKRIPDARANPV